MTATSPTIRRSQISFECLRVATRWPANASVGSGDAPEARESGQPYPENGTGGTGSTRSEGTAGTIPAGRAASGRTAHQRRGKPEAPPAAHMLPGTAAHFTFQAESDDTLRSPDHLSGTPMTLDAEPDPSRRGVPVFHPRARRHDRIQGRAVGPQGPGRTRARCVKRYPIAHSTAPLSWHIGSL